MIENYLLEQFVAVAECGTLLGASQKLHISQPSLSRSMHRIEDEFGVALFERSNSKIKLNETGKIAAEYARRALNANQDMVSRGIRILMDGTVGFWKDIVLSKLSESDLLIQNSFDALDELVEASSLPVFNSNQFLSQGYEPEGRKSIPINDPEVHVTYWLAALSSEQKTYRSVFNAARGDLLKKRGK